MSTCPVNPFPDKFTIDTLMIRDILSDWLSVTYQDQSIRYPNYIQNLAMP